MAECDSSDNNSDCLLVVQETQDLFQESQDLFQESEDFFDDDFQFPPTIRDDPLQQESSQKISLTCEDYLKDFTTDESSIDSDPTPDLEIATTSNCDKDNKKEESNESVKMKKWPILKLKMTEENSDDSDHTLTQDFEVACNMEIGCNVTKCTFSHILACNQF